MPKPLRAHASITRFLGPAALILGIGLLFPASLLAQSHGVSIFKSCVSPKNLCGSDADCADPNSCTGLGVCSSSGANHMLECTITLLNSDASLDNIRVNGASDTVFASGGNQTFNNLPVSSTAGTVSGDCDVGTGIDPTVGCTLSPGASVSFISNQYVIQPADPNPLPDLAAVQVQDLCNANPTGCNPGVVTVTFGASTTLVSGCSPGPVCTPTATPTPTNTPTNTPTSTPTNTPTNTPTSTPTNTPMEGPPPPPVPMLSFPMMALLGLALAGAGLFLARRQ